MRDLISKLIGNLEISKEDRGGDTHEIESVSYYRLTDFGQLLQAAEMVEQEQWELKFAKTEDNLSQGTLRVRRERSKGETTDQYWLTLKTSKPGVVGRDEFTREIDQSFFDAFKSMAGRGMCKLRCVIPVPGTEGTWGDERKEKFNGSLCWEVDVFYGENGLEFFPWVKVDLEAPSVELLQNVPEFPLTHERVITAPYGQRTEEDEALVSGFYNGPFLYTHQKDAEIKTAMAAKEKEEPKQEPEANAATAETPETKEPTNTDEAGNQDDSSS